MGGEGEVAALRAEVAELRRRLALIEELVRVAGRDAQKEDTGEQDPTGQLITVGDLDVLVKEGEDPEGIARAIRRAQDRDAGRFPFGTAGG